MKTWPILLAVAGFALFGCKQGPYVPEIVTPQEAHARIERGEAVVIADVRSKGSYNREHIEGAVHLPFARLMGEEKTKFELPKDRWVLLYCT